MLAVWLAPETWEWKYLNAGLPWTMGTANLAEEGIRAKTEYCKTAVSAKTSIHAVQLTSPHRVWPFHPNFLEQDATRFQRA